MRNWSLVLMIFLIFFYGYQPVEAQPRVEGEYLVKLKGTPEARKSGAFLNRHKGKYQLKATWGQLGIHYLSVPKGGNEDQFLRELRQDPDVDYVEPNYLLSLPPIITHQDQGFTAQNSSSGDGYWVDRLSLTETASVMQRSGRSVVVSVIDSGISPFMPHPDGSWIVHPVFQRQNALWENTVEILGNPGVDDDGNGFIDDFFGWNFADMNNNLTDSLAVQEHGTHVAGIVLRVYQSLQSGEESPIKIMPVKFINSQGTGTTSAAIHSIYYAVRNGARIINMSWGGTGYSQALHEALAYAYHQGVVLVAAAGNSSRNNDENPMYPANFPIPSQISVGASNDSDLLASFSNFGVQRVHVAAPGLGISSLRGCVDPSLPSSCYRILSGTSMAAPFVTGIAAIILLERPELNNHQVREIILNSASRINQLQNLIWNGSRAQALNALLNSRSVTASNVRPHYVPTEPIYGISRSPSEVAKLGSGCGLISSSVFQNWIQRCFPSFHHSEQRFQITWWFGFSLLPIIVWQILRIWSAQAGFRQRRKYERFIMDSDIRVRVGGQELTANLSTISVGGASLKVDQMIQHGGLVTLVIQSPDGSDSMEVTGRVVWSQANQSYGIQFSEEQPKVAKWGQWLAKAS